MMLHLPQAILVVLAVLELGVALAKDGQPGPARSFMRSLFNFAILMLLLWWGGFFA